MPVLILILLLISLLAAPVPAAAQTPESIKAEMGHTRMQAVFPEPGAEITDKRPLITVDLSRLESPVDTSSVVIMLNRENVTGEASVTQAYVIFTPRQELAPGGYEVRITASDLRKRALEPLEWNFTIKGPAPTLKKARPSMVATKADRTKGSLDISTDVVGASYIPGPYFDASQLFNEKKGTKLNADLRFSNTSPGRTITGSYRRDTLPYSSTGEDKFRLDYTDPHFSATFGDFWFRLSDLTVAGAEFNGARIIKTDRRMTYDLFSGRSQDPSTSGSFRQMTTGLRTDFKWNAKNTTSLTILSAWESSDAYQQQAAGRSPARDDLTGIGHEFRFGREMTAKFETVANSRKQSNGVRKFHDSADKLEISARVKSVFTEAELYRIGENFVPVGDFGAKYLFSDRNGYRLKSRYQPARMLALGGEIERYVAPSTSHGTKRGNAFVAISSGSLQSLTYRRDKLVTDDNGGIDTDTSGVTAVFTFKKLGAFMSTNLTAALQQTDYNNAAAVSDSAVRIISFGTSYRNIFSASLGYTISDGETFTPELGNMPANNRNFSFGLDWNVLPEKLTWSWRYETVGNSGTNTSNDEKRFNTALKYRLNGMYDLSLGYGRIHHNDAVTSTNHYSQTILRTGMGMKF